MLGVEEVPGWSWHPSSSLTCSRMLLCLLLLPVTCGGLLQKEAEFSLKVSENVTVQENLCVQVPCTFSYPRKDKANNSIFFSWLRKNKNELNPVATNDPHSKTHRSYQSRFSVHNCSLFIKNAQKFDTGQYILQVKKGNVTHKSEKVVFVHVSDLKQKPDIQGPETLKAEKQETLICKMPGACDSRHSLTFLWTGSALYSQSSGTKSLTSSKLSFTPKPQDHGTNITCQVTFKSSNVISEKTIQLNVTYPPKKPTIMVHQGNRTGLWSLTNVPYLPVLAGESLNLSCAVDSNPVVSLNWTKGKQTLASSKLAAAGVVTLQLQQVGLSDSGEYTCRAQDPLMSRKASLVLSVQYPPKLLSSSCSWTEEGLLCTCSVQAEPAPSLQWWLGENPVHGNSSNGSLLVVSTTSGVWTNSSLILRQKPDPVLSLRFEGKNLHGTHSLSILLVPDKTTPDTERSMKMLIIGTACGAAVTVFLALGLLMIVVKTLKKKSAKLRTKTSESEASVDDRHHPSETIFINLNEILKLKSSLRPQTHDTVCPTSEEGPELHYAYLNFQSLKPRNPQESAYTDTEYAEIKLQK
ncbi:sialic acid-binding Ig-like lectin 5 [Dromiciops gliroides]|uniref:sialic acid-binding Ig-like lectin 5 n=1 Tax=Dromiciops gliroides TaxID=33562 RepID=UPI001CC795CD|nr:sialic acid-binding Ig-like lectin 5 [Dromiciops gliroides]